MDEQARLQWRIALARESEARKAVLERAGGSLGGQRLRSWWSAVRDVLNEYARWIARYHHEPEPPPAELATVLAGQAGYLASGRIPDPIRQAAVKGRTGPGPTEDRDIRLAVAYRRACQPDGIIHNGETIKIDDPRPVERIHLWFGVSKRAVYDWLEKFEPAFLGVNRVNADVLTSLTKKAGQRYRQAGRSQKAIAGRGKKRRSAVKPKG
jgi:hypothetical protein